MQTKYGERPGMEAKAEHTPGPWVVSKPSRERGIYRVGAGEEFEIADVVGKANARLIAQAPALLAALELCARTLGDMERHAPCDSLHDTARDLRLELLPIIAAARGERGAK